LKSKKPFARAAKGTPEGRLPPTTLLTHLRGPPVLSYGHFGLSRYSTNQRSSAANTVPTVQSASQIENLAKLKTWPN
jgi:hypothetical protein